MPRMNILAADPLKETIDILLIQQLLLADIQTRLKINLYLLFGCVLTFINNRLTTFRRKELLINNIYIDIRMIT